jgi:FkbM family methyltransferase
MARIECPAEMIPHVQQVIQGEYSIPNYKKPDPVILDIGANVGAYAIWAFLKWPQATIHCYEPNPDNFSYLQQNLKNIHPDKKYRLYNVAVGKPNKNKLYLGKHNCGECSLYQIGEQKDEYITVNTIPPTELLKADIIKIDTEGSELDILRGVSLEYDAIAIEFHSESDRRKIDNLLKKYTAVHGFVRTRDKGVMSYLRNDLV